MYNFSVVMAVYERDNSSHLNEALKSLLNQTILPSEIILVIDGYINTSIEKVIQIYENKSTFKILRLKNNGGLANALNIAIKASSFDIIARMDADDICFKDRFEIQLKYLIEKKLSIVGGQTLEFGVDCNDIISARKVPLTHLELIKFMKYRSPFSHPTIIFRKNVFESLSGYDVNIFPEDYDFFVRAYLKGFKFGNVKENVLWFRLGENQADVLKRRWGFVYAKKEALLYFKFYKLDFFSLIHFLKILFFKTSLRIIPFFAFKYIYFNLFRNKRIKE